jgi:hypothetical protein
MTSTPSDIMFHGGPARMLHQMILFLCELILFTWTQNLGMNRGSIHPQMVKSLSDLTIKKNFQICQ